MLKLNECKIYERRYHLEHICNGKNEKCWRRAKTPKELKPMLQAFAKEFKRWMELRNQK